MVIVLDKKTRELIGTADTIAEAKALKEGRETVTEIAGNYVPRISRN